MEIFEKIKVDELFLDRENPRLVEFDIDEQTTEEEIITYLWESMDVQELVMSILASGYFENEPLIVDKTTEKNIVIEGNRRLAAVKVLREQKKYEDLLKNIKIPPEFKPKNLESLPVIIQSRQEAWQYLGFKHVNGPAKWGSYAKAKYISEVHSRYAVPLKEIGKQIGDTHGTVQKLYRGLMVIEQAERETNFKRNDIARNSFAFSHIYTGLQREGIQKFLLLKESSEESDSPVPESHLDNLEELCFWIYGSKKENIDPVIQSQNPHLKQLDSVLMNKEALAALRAEEPLIVAYDLTLPRSQVFEKELLDAKRALVKARGLLSESYNGSNELLRLAGTIATIADDLYEEMERKSAPKKKKRLTEDDI